MESELFEKILNPTKLREMALMGYKPLLQSVPE
jgi:hypothetical protein